MPSIRFKSKVWKQGSSSIITIPKEVREIYNIKEGDILDLSARLISEKEHQRELELKRLQAKYPLSAEGSIIHKDKEVAKLNKVFFWKTKSKPAAITSSPNFSWDDLPEKDEIIGIIFEGQFKPEAYGEIYSKIHKNDPYFKKRLTGTEKIKLKTSDGKVFLLKNVKYFDDIIKDDSNSIDRLEFYGDIED